MSSLLNSQGMVLATAMAVSGTVILFTFCRQKPFSIPHFATDPNSTSNHHNLRSCISSHEKKRDKKKKRVHFADDVIEPVRDSEVFTIKDEIIPEFKQVRQSKVAHQVGRIPANQMALYNGIRQDRMQRMACSY
ncbi:uncharacterized protein LOC131223150 [Magnolia sinica]|uniref:uncharacterized protein LOC131223150 n=1 Tax=Magnolia sinica TaxID=86752 RepID=UPI002659E092|nr:uncharacterized protein LOC131223150 [Magnolia sinica]